VVYGEAEDGRMLTARDVTNQSFTPTQFRHGYDERQVDDFLDQVVETLRYYEQGGRLGEQAPASPARPDFTPTTGRRGYDKREVDDFLDQVVETLRYYQRGGRPVAQAPASSARTKSEGLGQRATRWLRGDPPS
jgi:DivIVA domain-containing protein